MQGLRVVCVCIRKRQQIAVGWGQRLEYGSGFADGAFNQHWLRAHEARATRRSVPKRSARVLPAVKSARCRFLFKFCQAVIGKAATEIARLTATDLRSALMRSISCIVCAEK